MHFCETLEHANFQSTKEVGQALYFPSTLNVIFYQGKISECVRSAPKGTHRNCLQILTEQLTLLTSIKFCTAEQLRLGIKQDFQYYADAG